MKPKYKLVLSLTIMTTGLLLGLLAWRTQNDELDEYGVETKGVFHKLRGLKKTYASYEFSDRINVYRGEQRVFNRFIKKHRLGDTVSIIYSRIDPSISRIKYNK